MNFQGSRSFMKNTFRNMNKGFFNNKFSFRMCNTKLNSNFFYSLINNKFHIMNINFINSCTTLKSNVVVSKSLMSQTNDCTSLGTDQKQTVQVLENSNNFI